MSLRELVAVVCVLGCVGLVVIGILITIHLLTSTPCNEIMYV